MRITDPDIIKGGEKDLIDSVKEDLDLDAVKQILEKKIAATALSSRGGEIVVHNNEIAFRLDFDLNLSGSLMFDRQGNYIPDSVESKETDDPEDFVSEDLDLDDINITEALEEIGPDSLLGNSGEDDPKEEADAGEESGTDKPVEDDFDIDLPDYDLEDQLRPEKEALDRALESESDSETDDILPDDLIEEDMDDILKESRDFWDQKKES